MRDQGQWRNAEYHFVPHNDQFDGSNTFHTSKSVQSPVGKTFMKNKDGYSFGGKTKLGNMYHHKNAYTGLADFNNASCMSNNKFWKSTSWDPTKVYREYNQKVNDYTKNISQGIFSPGLTKQSVHSKSMVKYTRRLTGQRRSVGHEDGTQTKYQKYDPLRPNAFQLHQDGHKLHSPGRTVKSAKSLSRMIQKEKL